jgi:tRNA modification GTPase
LAHFDARSDLVVRTKIDQGEGNPVLDPRPAGAIDTSAHRGDGLDELRRRIEQLAHRQVPSEVGVVSATAARVAQSFERAADAVERGKKIVAARGGDELVAAEVRLALDELGKVSGVVATDDVLERIFTRFCIGK